MSYSHEQMIGDISKYLSWGHIPSFQFREVAPNGKSGEEGNLLTVQQPAFVRDASTTPFRRVFHFEMQQGRWVYTAGVGGIEAFADLCGVKPLSIQPSSSQTSKLLVVGPDVAPEAVQPNIAPVAVQSNVAPVVIQPNVAVSQPQAVRAPAKPKLAHPLLADTSAVDIAAKDDDPSCVICMEFQNRVVLVPCGHRCLCICCAKLQSTGYMCPICRVVATVACVVYN